MTKSQEQERKEMWQRDMDKLRNLAALLGPGDGLSGIVTRRAYHYYVIEEIFRDECSCLGITLRQPEQDSWQIHHVAILATCDMHKRNKARIMEIIDWNGL